jgi:hypothetical protein
MEMNADFYKTDLGKRVCSLIHETSVLLIARDYASIPAGNIKTELSPGWISAMDEMLDHYYAKFLPWEPNKVEREAYLLVETEKSFIVDAPIFHEENGIAVDGAIYMGFEFGYDGSFISFNGIKY